jgi:CRISPR-associated endonuclease/helicase Cas3
MESYEDFFRRATGRGRPYDYQAQLAAAAKWPAFLAVPTGCGKTNAVLSAWAYRRLVRGVGPRRLVYALPMRTLVEQTAEVARSMRDRVTDDYPHLRVDVLMGGEPRRSDDWRRHPEAPQIVVGTIDMLLSRALNRGYGESRFAWPVSFGLLNADCVWVFDEIQLMGPARVTSAQLQGLRAKLGVSKPVQTMWVSATVDREALSTVDHPLALTPAGTRPPDELRLPDTDRRGPLRRRLDAGKRLIRLDLSRARSTDLPRRIAAGVIDHHRPGTRSIVVVNRVELAQRVFQAVEQLATHGERVVLLHSRFRPGDRADRFSAAVDPAIPPAGTIVVSTQVIEAGVDVSSALLATETAPFSSIVQRVGRCNRAGDDEDATVLWLDRGGDLDARQAAPYDPRDIAAAHAALAELAAGGTSLSPAALERRQETDPVAEQRETWTVLRRRHLIDLFDTTPDLSDLTVDVSRYIRADDDATVSVCFRDNPANDIRRPARQELVDVPIGTLGDRDAWIHDLVDGEPVRLGVRRAYPGLTLMLRADDGGYDSRLGWLPTHRGRVEPIEPADAERADGADLDPNSHTGRWVRLSDHLQEAEREALALVEAVGQFDGAEAVVAAAALHDVGKAHPGFQQQLLVSVPDTRRSERASELWAKSATRERRRPGRQHVRHELASLLALLEHDDLLPAGHPDLVRYLVLAHHGKLRLTIRSTPEEYRRPDAPDGERTVRGVTSCDELPPVVTPRGVLQPKTLDLAALDATDDRPSWTARACALRDAPALGPFRLGYLEALTRIADWRASA